MNFDCQWFEENLEAFFCDRLNMDEERRARSHVESCDDCRQKVEELRSLDPVIKQVFRHDLAMARTPRTRRSPTLAGAVAAALAVMVLAILWKVPTKSNISPPAAPAPAAVAQTTLRPAAAVPKIAAVAQTQRTKPEPAADKTLAAAPDRAPAVREDAPDFLVTDPAGYARTLTDYRGYILIFGIWRADQPKTISNLERVYQKFGPNTKLRILGVAMRRQPRPKIATFPIAFNQGSKLLGAAPDEFLVVDGNGKPRLSGSLLQEPNSLLNSIEAAVNQIQTH